MKDIDQITTVYFLGIGGIGMSALARYFHSRGVNVCGYDKTPSEITKALQLEGIEVSFEDDPAGVSSQPELVVYTPAVPTDTNLFTYFSAQDIPLKKRSEILGLISSALPTIAVAGTHGKTTIGAMLTHIFIQAGVPCTAFLGGISTNYNTNYVGEPGSHWLIAEADEFDRSFLQLHPRLALISSMDTDHLDIYGSYEELTRSFNMFTKQISKQGVLIVNNRIKSRLDYSGKCYTYGFTRESDYSMNNTGIREGYYEADFNGMLEIQGVMIGHPGRHNLENALAAAALAHQAGIAPESIKRALSGFTGVKRRFEVHIQTTNTVYLDDYAHHPEEIRACILSAREIWPKRKITGVFQPHLYTRTRDLADQFADSLSLLDELILLDIYPAREEPIEGVDSEMILDKVKTKAIVSKREELLSLLKRKHTDILITMGAGDIDRFTEPIKQLLQNKGLS